MRETRPSPGGERQPAYDRLREVVERHGSFVLGTHRDPDGDGLGAEAAMSLALAQMGKRALVVNADEMPEQYCFLPGSDAFRVFNDEAQREAQSFEVAMLLDASLPARTGRAAPVFSAFRGLTAAIDHHEGGGWAQAELIAPEASAATELVHTLLLQLGVEITPPIAEALYTGIACDTDGFRNGNTSPGAHALAAELTKAGACIERVHREMFASWPVARLKLLGGFLAGLQPLAGGRLVWGGVTQDDLRRHGLTPAAIEGFVEQSLGVKGAELAVFFMEEPDGVVRVSFRSRGGVRVDALAVSLGGGGHPRAAGTRITASFHQAADTVLKAATAYLEHLPRG